MAIIDDVISELVKEDGRVTSTIIQDLIDDHETRHDAMITLYERYKGTSDGVPILTRTFADTTKINNKLANDYMGEIIDVKVGYLMGKPISYLLDKNATNYEKTANELSDFTTRNNIDDLDAETAKYAAICGYGSRLLYIDEEGKERVMNVPPWECIFIYDRSINAPQYAMRYYDIDVQDGSGKKAQRRIEWYDNKNVYFFVGDSNDGYDVDYTDGVIITNDAGEAQEELSGYKPHLFDGIPLVAFLNNEELMGDVEKVESLIDGYNNTLSDINSEVEQFRLAYMAFYGSEPTAAVLEAAKRSGAFGADIDSKIEFITKEMNDGIIEHHLDRLDENIMRFSKSVNFRDEVFNKDISAVALKFKLFGLEAKCIIAERKFSAAIRQMFGIIGSAWRKKGIDFDEKDLFVQFKRNFPLNLEEEARTTGLLKGFISEQTRLSLLSFIDDVDYEAEEMKKDTEGMIDLDAIGGGTDGESTQSDGSTIGKRSVIGLQGKPGADTQ